MKREGKQKTVESYSLKIHIAGDINQIKQSCRQFCNDIGLCVTVTETDYIYTGGSQTGATIGLINYPKFPKTETELNEAAVNLGLKILHDACQESFTIESPKETTYISFRGDL